MMMIRWTQEAGADMRSVFLCNTNTADATTEDLVALQKKIHLRNKFSDLPCGVLTMLVAKIQFLRESINLWPICREAAWKHRHCLWRYRWWSSPSKHWETIWQRVQLHHVLVWLCRLLSRLRTSSWSARISSLCIQHRMASRKWHTCI